MNVRQIPIEEAMRALNSVETISQIFTETQGYSMRKLFLVHRPARISQPISYLVRLKERQFDETDKVTEREFFNYREAVDFYNEFLAR